jgi:hypothetical protein
VQKLEQDNYFTYWSQNIENHAKPSNTCNVYNKETYLWNTHPILDEIKYKYLDKTLNKELILLLDELSKKSLITKGQKSYYVDNHNEQGFPRLMINIRDKELLKLSKKYHPEEFKENKKFLKKTKILHKFFHNINDIKVIDIEDEQPHKVAFKKILGNQDDYTERMMMYGKNKQTLFAALKRQLKSAPVPSKQDAHEFLEYSKKVIDKEIGNELNNFGYDISQWYNHLSRSKQIQIKPIYNLYMHPEQLINYTTEQIQDMLSLNYTAIVKAELQELDGKPRMVCSIPQHVKYVMGPVTWMLEEIAAKYFNGYCGGKNLDEMSHQLNEYIKQGFTKVVEGDGSAFDNTQDIMLKGVDRYIYNKIKDKIYHVDKQIFEKIANSYYKVMDVNYRDKFTNKIHTYVRYYVLGTVFSGDCDTTLMNTIRMVLYNRFVNDKAGLIYGKDYVVLSKGDDFSVLYKDYISDTFIDNLYYKYFLPKSDKPEEITDIRQFGLGQILKFLDKGDASTFKFCSLRSWFKNADENEITLTRDPKKLYNKALYSIKYKNYNKKQQYLYHIQQAVSYLTNYPGIKIFEMVAFAHYKQARIIRQNNVIKLNKKQKFVNNKIYEQFKLNQKEHKEDIEFTENTIMNRILSKLFETKQREKYIDFYTNYWEQVQQQEKSRSEINSIKELEYINNQINAEFDTEELKSLLALQ